MKKTLILLFVLCIMLVGCGETVTPTKVDKQPTAAGTEIAADTATKPEPEAAKTETFKIGDTLNADDIYYTVNSVREDKGSDFVKPKDGNIYYLVDVTVENKKSESFSVSSLLMFKLFDSDGYNYSITFGPETKGSVDGEIAAGRKLRGELTFEIPAESKGLELEIDHSLLGSGKIIIALDR